MAPLKKSVVSFEDMMMEQVSTNELSVRVYSYRWKVLAIYCLLAFNNFSQYLQFSIISNIAVKYYHVNTFVINLTGLIFFLVYVIFFLPVSYFIEKYSLRITIIFGSAFTLIGNLIKLFCVSPENVYVAIIGQGFVGVGQVFILSTPSKFAATWFGPNEVSTACAIAIFGTQLGLAIGCVIPLTIKNGSTREITHGLSRVMNFNAISSIFVFLIVCLFFEAKPKSPPSRAQAVLDNEGKFETFLENCKQLFHNLDYLRLLISFGFSNGLWASFGLLLNIVYLHYFPNSEKDAGTIALMSIISGGCFGSLFFGFILDKTHQFKKATLAILFISALCYILLSCSLVSKMKAFTYLTFPLFGFFLASIMVVGYEFVIEVTYPLPPALSCSILNTVVFCCGILITPSINFLLETIGYDHTHGIVVLILLCCAVNICFMKPVLKRRNTECPGNEHELCNI